jgi:hypothetical protein
MSAPARDPFRIVRHHFAFRRNPRVQLESPPFDVDVVILEQQIDPSLADIAKRSNEVRKDVQQRAFWGSGIEVGGLFHGSS